MASCDTMVALRSATASGVNLFAKNSDRPPGECQPLAFFERAEHPAGRTVRCQYIDVPQVRKTHRVLGSKPVWLWGFEHGINEHGLVIGNEAVFSREAPASTGLLGMDLVRLGLERAANVEEALEVLSSLLAEHGQGGSGWAEIDFPYDSSFLLADAREAWILETSGREWAARRCRETDAISNQLTIGTDWDRRSESLVRNAVRAGLPTTDPFDFSGTYRDVENIPRALSEGRLRRSRAQLAEAVGRIDVESIREVLRDHHGAGRRFEPTDDPDAESFYTICMHQGLSRTTASLIAELPPEPGPCPLVWASYGRPCCSFFFPVFVAPSLPRAFAAGSKEPSDVLWWIFEKIALEVESEPERATRVRARFDAVEAELCDAARAAQREMAAGSAQDAEALVARFASTCADRVVTTARDALGQIQL